ncbi:MAG TPA: serine/threonine-protein kinase [Solirubrobacteraceae bacterium]|nr:serine/threonine-protein kinase [Solirubrobacteraceae bacterium]
MTEPAAGVTMAGGRYRLVHRLGGGGMATVWMAEDTRLGRQVAVKVISDALAAQAPYVERFRREARIAAGLSHPNLVKVYDFGSDGERPFLVMEYIDGAALGRGSTGAAGARVDSETLARDLLDALGHIHAAGIVHRDIKPANVLVGPDGRPRLTDFGIAQAEGSTGLTETGQVIGTLKYLAPEVARGHPATPRSDLYSLGVLLSEVTAGNESSGLARLIDRLMQADPSRRPSSAAQALSALDGATGVTAPTRVLAGTAATRPLATHADHRRAWLATGVAAALAAVIVVIVLATSGGGGGKSSAATVRAASPNAPLSQQLNTLDRMVDRVSGQ